MKKIMMIVNDQFFIDKFKAQFFNFEIYSYSSPQMFFSDLDYKKQLLLEKINTTDIFLLDVEISKEENIFESGIFELIACYRKKKSKVFSISDYTQDEIFDIMGKIKIHNKMDYDMFLGKNLRGLEQAINIHSKIVLN